MVSPIHNTCDTSCGPLRTNFMFVGKKVAEPLKRQWYCSLKAMIARGTTLFLRGGISIRHYTNALAQQRATWRNN